MCWFRLIPTRGTSCSSLRLSQAPAQDSAERPLPRQGRQAWEVKQELPEALQEQPEELVFATPGQVGREDLDVACWKWSTVECWKSSAAAPDSAKSSPAPSTRRADGLFF